MPRPIMRGSTAWLFDLGAEVYGWFTAQTTWRASCARLADHLPASDGGRVSRVVDLGCGPGVSTFEIARRQPVALVVGLDLASRMLHEARRRQRWVGLRGGRLEWLCADAGTLPFRSGSMDALTGHSFLYLLGEQTRRHALPEMRRVLRPGGRVVLMEPNARAASPRQVLGVSRDPRHLLSVALWRPFSRFHGRYSPETLCATLAAAGFVECQAQEVLDGLGVLAWAEKPLRG